MIFLHLININVDKMLLFPNINTTGLTYTGKTYFESFTSPFNVFFKQDGDMDNWSK